MRSGTPISYLALSSIRLPEKLVQQTSKAICLGFALFALDALLCRSVATICTRALLTVVAFSTSRGSVLLYGLVCGGVYRTPIYLLQQYIVYYTLWFFHRCVRGALNTECVWPRR